MVECVLFRICVEGVVDGWEKLAREAGRIKQDGPDDMAASKQGTP